MMLSKDDLKHDFIVDTNIGAQSLHRPYNRTESADFASLNGSGSMIVGLYPLYLFEFCLCATHLVGVMFTTTNSTSK